MTFIRSETPIHFVQGKLLFGYVILPFQGEKLFLFLSTQPDGLGYVILARWAERNKSKRDRSYAAKYNEAQRPIHFVQGKLLFDYIKKEFSYSDTTGHQRDCRKLTIV
jgi:hypothetical protein